MIGDSLDQNIQWRLNITKKKLIRKTRVLFGRNRFTETK